MESGAGEKTVAITGCNRGIGRALAEAFASAGWRVIVHARTASQAEEVAAAVGAAARLYGDLDDPALASRLRDVTAAGLDLLVLSAAVLGPLGPLDAVELPAFGEVMRLNVDRQLALFQAALPGLLARRGAVIWMSSGLGRFALPNYGAYCVSKHAVEALSKLAHAEYAARGLISVTVAPGMVQTEMLKAAIGSEDVSAHTPPEVFAASFLRLIANLTPARSGEALESSDF
jgi:NAD(P)-dependent dehydrogenase (short-subunit alcohol dehydrogenase family)